MDNVILYKGKYYSLSNPLFKLIDIKDKGHYVSYDKLMEKSKLMKKMTTMDISEQKDSIEMKLEIDNCVMLSLIEYIEKDQISNTKIDWKSFINTCDYLSIDVELLSRTLQAIEKLENSPKRVLSDVINERIKEIERGNKRIREKEEFILYGILSGIFFNKYTSDLLDLYNNIISKIWD